MSPVEEGPIWPAEVYQRVADLQRMTHSESLELHDRLSELRHQIAARELPSSLEATADQLDGHVMALRNLAHELRERPLA